MCYLKLNILLLKINMNKDKEIETFKRTLSKFLTGITVVTAVDNIGNPIGMTVNSFSSVSLDPPLVLWSIEKKQPSYNFYKNSNGYVVNILSKNQLDLCNIFSSQSKDKFKNINWQRSANGFPLIDNCLAWFDCVKWKDYPGGDHQILVGKVTSSKFYNLEPLAYWNSKIS